MWKDCDIEVDQQPESQTRHLEAASHLRRMNWMESIDALQLEQEFLVDHQVKTMQVDRLSSIDDRIFLFSFLRNS